MKIQDWRKQQGLTLAEMAERAGVSESAMSSIRERKAAPRLGGIKTVGCHDQRRCTAQRLLHRGHRRMIDERAQIKARNEALYLALRDVSDTDTSRITEDQVLERAEAYAAFILAGEMATEYMVRQECIEHALRLNPDAPAGTIVETAQAFRQFINGASSENHWPETATVSQSPASAREPS